ncbi:MAG: MazG family protein [Oscillospiraceae bacterium]|jgi:tetrapyrrole methylase family protein/MazG family protein|nr:MazG family protein [Oscillospiraceae bacterium]
MIRFPEKSEYNVYDLVKLIEILRSPEGCPWDREQTHESHRRDVLEEAYEVAEAIDERDSAHLKEELGDLLMAVIFHTQIELESGGFNIDAVADNTVRKLIYRHPHVFGDTVAEDSTEVLRNWDKLKKTERSEETLADTLNNVARSLPALWRSEKIINKIKKSGAELEIDDGEVTEEIIGNSLLKAVKTAYEQGIDPEYALHSACERIIAKYS